MFPLLELIFLYTWTHARHLVVGPILFSFTLLFFF